MTKTCPICHATVLSSSQPNLMGTMPELQKMYDEFGGEDWKDDPSADERWNAGVDFAMLALCGFMNVDPKMVSWDAATETVDGDVRAVIGNILRAKMGEDWSPRAALAATPAVGVEAEPCPYCSDAKRTGLPGNACENCMNTGLKYPERAAVKDLANRLDNHAGWAYRDHNLGLEEDLIEAAAALRAQPPSPLRETCIECGKCDPCDDDCPNHQDQEPAPNDREIRTGAHLLQMAKSLGWSDDGEGALEFMLRRCREVAFEDCQPTSPLRGITDEMVSLALCANVDLIQGFTYEARHVIRDFRVDYKKGVEVWSGTRGNHDEMMKRIEFLKMRAALEAAFSASPPEQPAADPVRLEAWIKENYAGHGRALRLQSDPPLEGEPWMSMDEAKELTRQAVALFAPRTET